MRLRRGWRALRDPKKKIATILAYLHRYALSPARWRPQTPKGSRSISPSLLIFHVGHLWAEIGNTAQAIKVFSRLPKTKDRQWDDYVEATIAFLKQDRKSLERFAAPENYNRQTLDRLRKHWGQSYAVAYSAE